MSQQSVPTTTQSLTLQMHSLLSKRFSAPSIQAQSDSPEYTSNSSKTRMKTRMQVEVVWPSSSEEAVQRPTEDSSSSTSNSKRISRIMSPSSRHCRKDRLATFTAHQTAIIISISCTINCQPTTSSVDSVKAGLERRIGTGAGTSSRSERLSPGKLL